MIILKEGVTPKPHICKHNGEWKVFNPLYNSDTPYPMHIQQRWLAAYEWCHYVNGEGF